MIKNININNYDTYIFDCDGVILNSNKIKSEAFFYSALIFDEKIANDFLEFHNKNGGISRYVKFDYLLKKILPKYNQNIEKTCFDQIIDDLLLRYSQKCKSGLKTCEVAEKIKEIKNFNEKKDWLVISGSDQNELRKTLKEKKISHLFNKGIYGSPENKFEIIKREKKKGNIKGKTILIGDSKYDYLVSKESNIEFVFLYEWTELPDWQDFVFSQKIIYKKNLKELFLIN